MICATAVAQQPRIDSVSPSQGPIAGGTIIMQASADGGFRPEVGRTAKVSYRVNF